MNAENYNTRDLDLDLSCEDGNFAIVIGRFNSLITERLFEAAVEALNENGVSESRIESLWVPGAYEIPLAAKHLAMTNRFRGLVALGCVIRGETPHFEYVAGECSSGLMRVGLEYDIPIGFGVLTVDTLEQAMQRAPETKEGNKGRDAALAVLEMVKVLA